LHIDIGGLQLGSAQSKKTIKTKELRTMAKNFKYGVAASVIAVTIATAGITTVTSFTFVPEAQAWSIKSAAKKTVKAAKYVGRKTGRAVSTVNRVIVPSEIRNGASKVKRGVYKAGRFVVAHPYGRRCKPNKYLQPVCTVKGKRASIVRDHRTKTIVHDHRTTSTN
jgi:hypothetical protein